MFTGLPAFRVGAKTLFGSVFGSTADGDEADGTPADVVHEMVDCAARSTTAVLLRLAPAPTAAFAAVAPLLHDALALAPDDIASAVEKTVRRIARLVRLLIRKVHELLEAVSAHYRDAVEAVLEACDLEELLAEPPVTRLLRGLYRAEHITVVTKQCMLRARRVEHVSQSKLNRRFRRMRKLAGANRRWVGPVHSVAKGLKPLWTVSAGGVPAAPVLAGALLAWSVVVTGDQLDADGPYPAFWKGPASIADGR